MGNQEVYKALEQAIQSKEKVAIATVVKVYGSAYRREGSKMYIDEAGKTIGLISGGCLEADVAEVAKEVILKDVPVLRRYNMDEDLVWGMGLGCPGEVEIYIEPLHFY